MSKQFIKHTKPQTLHNFNGWLFGSLVGLVTATFATYWSTLNYPFQFDDLMNITKNFAIRACSFNFQSLLSTRWIGELSNKLNFKLGHFQPWSYRFVNVNIHLFAGLTLFALIYLLCQNQKRDSFLRKWSTAVAFLTAAIFLLHPVQSQTVNYAIQARLEGLAAMLGLLALTMLAAWMRSGSRLWFGLACLSGFLSCGTKEVIIVLPVLAVILDWYFFAKMDWKVLKPRLFGHAVFASIIFGTIGYYLGSKFVSDALLLKAVSKNNRGNIISHGLANEIGVFQYLISEFKVLVHYISIFFMPQRISVEYDWKLATSFWSLEVILPLLFLLGLGSLTTFWTMFKKHKEFCFSTAWFFICLAPRSSVVPCAELVCDYKTYLASVGICFLLAYLILNFLSLFELDVALKVPNKVLRLTLFFFAAVLPMSLATHSRNKVWSCSELFWQDIVAKAPSKARANNNYAVAMCENGKFTESIPYFKKAIELDKVYCDPWSNVAVAYSMTGNQPAAMDALKQAIVIFPEYPEAHNNLGAMFINSGDLEQAELCLSKAVELRPHYGKAYLNLGRVFAKKGDGEKSFAFYKKATETDLDNAEGFSCLGLEALRIGKYAEAANALELAIKRGANSPVVIANLAGAYCNSGKEKEGEKLFEFLYNNNPQDPSVAYNLALCRQNRGDFKAALGILSRVTIDKNCPDSCISLLAECIEKADGLEKAQTMLTELCETNIPDQHKQIAKNELLRVKFQAKLNKNGGVLTGKDFQEAFGAPGNSAIEQA